MTWAKFHHVNGSAVLSEGLEGRYRELLLRRLPGGDGWTLVFCMLNPSTADHRSNDPTIRRCIGFAKREGASALAVINLFAFRATKPGDLLQQREDVRVGPINDDVIRDVALTYGRVVCAWGANAPYDRQKQVAEIFRFRNVETLCLGHTKDGKPRHPLFVSAWSPLVPFNLDSLT